MNTPNPGQGAAGLHLIDNQGDRKKKVPKYLYAALFFLLVCANALIAKFVVFSFNFAPGTAYLYVSIAFMIVFALWFGMYGAIAAYAGCFIGAGLLSGLPLDLNIVWSLTDFWEALIPLVAFRALGCDPALRNRRDVIVLLVFGVIVNNIAGAVWGPVALALGGQIAWDSVVLVSSIWFLGNFILCLCLVPFLLLFFTPLVENHELYIRKYWH
ncbi:putative integral membrane sensor protein [Methanolacinia petrolearia DSM 11571]|uniref:Putative integral membrane sensor protein n=1 Tax=Methanolacinia petrolearia (strain DSM 11571 / OCM 486 / SEBR 4847) TaxID=679926 RepID=E1RG99_METP4|nr:MASE1 domain-containing protein [Methanolacinia petrolearia]ADN37413.1 putative integral membrane sensor protein [Methanolacinia petrolearia DSM 11571]